MFIVQNCSWSIKLNDSLWKTAMVRDLYAVLNNESNTAAVQEVTAHFYMRVSATVNPQS
jgi:hypothetical protein